MKEGKHSHEWMEEIQIDEIRYFHARIRKSKLKKSRMK
jgi:hypothetical protein